MPDPKKIAWLYHETGEASYRASQFMAIEGQCFVLVASQILTEKNLEKNNLSGNPVTKTVSSPFPLTSQMETKIALPIPARRWFLYDIRAGWKAIV